MNLPNKSADVWHFRIFSALTIDGQRVHSPGHDPGSRVTVAGPHQAVVVRYRLKRNWLGRWRVEFRTDPPDSPIPPTILVIHPRALPANVNDGNILDRFPAAGDHASFPIRTPGGLAESYYRVFIDPMADPDGLLHIELRDPPGMRSRL